MYVNCPRAVCVTCLGRNATRREYNDKLSFEKKSKAKRCDAAEIFTVTHDMYGTSAPHVMNDNSSPYQLISACLDPHFRGLR